MKLKKLSPNFEVNNIQETVEFYQSLLGFSLIMCVPETQDSVESTFAPDKKYVYAMVERDGIELMFQRSDSFKQDVTLSKGLPIGASVSFYMEVEELEKLYADVKDQVKEISPLKTAWYGMKEFYIKDLNGYILGFAEKV